MTFKRNFASQETKDVLNGRSIGMNAVINEYLADISWLLGQCYYKAMEVDAIEPNTHDWELMLSNIHGMKTQVEAFRKKLSP